MPTQEEFDRWFIRNLSSQRMPRNCPYDGDDFQLEFVGFTIAKLRHGRHEFVYDSLIMEAMGTFGVSANDFHNFIPLLRNVIINLLGLPEDTEIY
jgi:hypothetical protein